MSEITIISLLMGVLIGILSFRLREIRNEITRISFLVERIEEHGRHVEHGNPPKGPKGEDA